MEVVWARAVAVGRERCAIDFPDEGGMLATSVVRGSFGECRYRAAADERERFVELGDGPIAVERTDGGWLVDGMPRPDLASAHEIDLSISRREERTSDN